MARLFVALPLPEMATRKLSDLPPRRLDSVRCVPAERLHLTLRFLGECDEESVTEALREVAFPHAFDLVLRGTGVFGPPTRPSVLWVGVKESRPLRMLHDRVERALVHGGFDRDSRSWRPHVTVARIRRPRHGEDRQDKEAVSSAVDRFLESGRKFECPAFRVDGFVLIASESTEEGPRYREVARFPG